MHRLSFRFILLLAFYLAVVFQTDAMSFALDSIAEWGRFPRFCIGVYRWGDKFFNSYDSSYVEGTGYKFNVKLTTDSWTDYYNFEIPNDKRIRMISDPSTTAGVYLTYLALSAGYNINVSNLISGAKQSRTRFNFGFNCSLFAAEWSYMTNDVGSSIRWFGNRHNGESINLPFRGINISTWNLDTYYFFNHKNYSQAAAFNFSKVQKKSQGSFYAGISIYTQKFNFDFSELPDDMKMQLPSDWPDYRYRVRTHNYAFRLGYGYNWVFARHWNFGVSESPIVGLRKGKVINEREGSSFALNNRFRMSVVWNNRKWFAGAVSYFDIGLIYDKDHTLASGQLCVQFSVGYRFNIW